MTQNVSSRSVASASCSALRTERSHIVRRITRGQPTITRLLGKMSVIPLRIQTGMPDRCMEGRLAREIQPPPVEPEIPGGPSGFQGTGNWTPFGSGGQPSGQKNWNGTPGGGNQNPGQTPQSGGNKRIAQGSQGKGKGNPTGTSSSGRGKGGGMWPYPWTHVGTPSHLGHMDRVAATMPSQAHAGAAQEAPDIG